MTDSIPIITALIGFAAGWWIGRLNTLRGLEHQHSNECLRAARSFEYAIGKLKALLSKPVAGDRTNDVDLVRAEVFAKWHDFKTSHIIARQYDKRSDVPADGAAMLDDLQRLIDTAKKSAGDGRTEQAEKDAAEAAAKAADLHAWMGEQIQALEKALTDRSVLRLFGRRAA